MMQNEKEKYTVILAISHFTMHSTPTILSNQIYLKLYIFTKYISSSKYLTHPCFL